jgi:hypothetical protein
MPSSWQLKIARNGEQRRRDRKRTVGSYQVFHDGAPVAGLSGFCAETHGPGDNLHAGNNRCVEPGVYTLSTEDGKKYCPFNYTSNTNPAKLRRPALLLGNTGKRGGILIHPARGFLWSVGCINPAQSLRDASSDVEFLDSRRRVIALIDDLVTFLGEKMPKNNGHRIPNAEVVISDQV